MLYPRTVEVVTGRWPIRRWLTLQDHVPAMTHATVIIGTKFGHFDIHVYAVGVYVCQLPDFFFFFFFAGACPSVTINL